MKSKMRVLLEAKAQVSAAARADGFVAAVDWKGNLYLQGETLNVVAAHRDRAQGVAILEDGTIVTSGWDDAVRRFDRRGALVSEWSPEPTAGPGFQRCWGLRSHGSRVAIDRQNGATAQLWLGEANGAALKVDETPATHAKTDGHTPTRTIGLDAHAATWLAVDEIREVRFDRTTGAPPVTVPRFTRAAVVEAGRLAYVEEQALVLGETRVTLPAPDDFYPMASSRAYIAVKTGPDRISIYTWDGALVAEAKHKQCCGLSFDETGLMSWGWDKKVLAWPLP